MTSKSHKKTQLLVFALIVITTFVLVLNSNAYPSAKILGCHPGGYTITCDVSEIKAEASDSYIVEVTGTGIGVVIDVYTGALDNDEFTITPNYVIADGSADDLDPTANSIRVELNITMPSQSGIYTLRILSRASTLSGVSTALAEFDIEVTIGIVTKSALEIFFDHSNFYLGGLALAFMGIGAIIFLLKNKRHEFTKSHGIFMTTALMLMTVNVFLILNDTMDFALGSMDLTNSQDIGQLSHIVLGSIGYIAGIIVVIGTYTNVPANKLKLAVFIMFLGWTFNFLYGTIMTPSSIV